MDNKKNIKKEVKIDIRKLPIRREFGIPNIIAMVVISLALTGAIIFFRSLGTKGEEVSVSKIVTDIFEEKYDKIILKDGIVTLEMKGEGNIKKSEYALLPGGTDFYQILSDSGLNIKDLENDFYQPAIGITFGDIVTFVLLGAGLILVFIMIKNMQTSGGKIMDFGESKARLLFGKKTGVTFEDVAGIEDVKEELTEIVDFLKQPKKYLAAGARIPKGVLLAGAPGTGKTLLAKAVAGEAGVPFFHTSGSEFEEMLVGAGASRVRDLFKKARSASPCIIFIDEIDAVAKKRGTVLHSGAGEQTLNQILVEMDGLEERQNVIVLAATNRPDVLDPALLRPGRFDRTVVVNMPDFKGRRAILDVHAKNKVFETGVDLDILAKKTVGYSGADLENLLNESAIMAARENRKKISQEDIMEAYLKVKLGRKKTGDKEAEDIRKTAYHEAGHAIVAKFTEGSDPVEQVSVISRGLTGGITVYLPEKDTKFLYKKQMLAWLRTGVAGRVAEELFIGEISTGASNDIEQITNVAREMVMQYGMSEKLGMIKYGDMEETKHLGYTYGGGREYSEKTAELIDQEVKRFVDEAYEYSKKLLQEKKEYVEKLVNLLVEKEVVVREEFDALF
ncbi:MAG TPA: ATP-dependent zinc metalloprotease FtsH [Candidatus Dojkabacteria bacterium]|nr:ATP-dependent zinc metalloprotease FtsH [Candidatus Dojkabacteria bacterium]HOR05852.1 ATP-dependent zinc metalloprotease FtsH [Candidatus Dojkabacteria bacterium]HOT61069.1 ATP-dependent zinc metalloprotease FtsH [Candidatus Dojkabacteria bacterium]